ncbi:MULTISPECIES: ADP-ribosylglycohydrolase family protein [Methylotenera]|uniref:ADP-ribosylglycohydrolase family protein n=1 Tax=Methylotenera TaxID=359407 RepID=UPI0003629482|nr:MULTISPECIES: ADP-ribosylglycohydrolase family protein [Methylotenera]
MLHNQVISFELLSQRYEGCLIGLAIGDALGTTVEFCPRDSFSELTTIIGGGIFHLKAGQWTDDTSMTLCLAESLIICNGFNAHHQMTNYLRWWKNGHLSSTGRCFDIGNTVRAALSRFEKSGNPYSGSTNILSAGNGSLMRLAPVVLYFYPLLSDVLHYSAESSKTTHAAPEAIECCQLLAFILYQALSGKDKATTLDGRSLLLIQPKVISIACGNYKHKTKNEVKGSSYVIDSLEAALWCFYNSTSYREAVLMAANLGDDADTTAAITGQIAGAFYGVNNIPNHWQNILYQGKEIKDIAIKLLH